jgi:polygalacturonase
MDYYITDFGAASDVGTLNTAAIQNAIDQCSAKGGGRVRVPAGVFKTGTIWLKSHVELHLEQGAVLLASENLSDYNADDAYPQNFMSQKEEWNFKHLILAVECTDVSVTGYGVIDGNGKEFYCAPIYYSDYYWRDGLALANDKTHLRPGQCLCFVECTNITIENITIRNTTCWCCFLHGCENAGIRGVKIFNSTDAANTDGIDIDACRNVTVSDCIIDTGDDAIAIRSNTTRLNNKSMTCEYITITNSILASSSAVIRIGVGNSNIRHIRVSNLVIKRGGQGVLIMPNHSQNCATPIEDVSITGVSAVNVAYPFQILGTGTDYAKDITLADWRISQWAAAAISSKYENVISQITVKDMKIMLTEYHVQPTAENRNLRGNSLIECNNVSDVIFDNVILRASPKELQNWDGIYYEENCRNIVISNCNFA